MAVIDSSRVKQVIGKLHANGGRMTSQRRLILETLQDCPDHPTAEDIFTRAHTHDPSLHLSTVYRTMRWLEEEGFVSPRWFEEERRQERFDPINGEAQDHYHFRCQLCNTIVEFSEPQIEEIKKTFQQQHGGLVNHATLVFYGICEHCLTAHER